MSQYSEPELFLIFLVVVYQHLKLINYTLKTPFKKKILVDENNSVIHSYKNNKNKKALIFLAGGSQFEFCYYIKKLVDDLIEYNQIHKEYDIFIFENTHELNFLCVNYISNWIQDHIFPKYTHITICGLSNGGCIGSQVITNIIHNKYNKIIPQPKFKLITIDSVFSMVEIVNKAEKNIFFRKDIWIAYWFVFYKSLGHTHLQSKLRISDIFNSKDYKSFLKIFERMYGINKKSFEELSTLNLNIGKKCDIFNIYSIYDPIIEREINKKYYRKQQKKGLVQPNIKNIPFNMITHNTQMVTEKYSKKFCKLIMNCLHS
jgi:hypothetical protein